MEDAKKSKQLFPSVHLRVSKCTATTPAGDDAKGEAPPPPKDEDPDGTKLLSTTTPLEQAAKLLRPLLTAAPERLDVWIAVYDVAIRRSMSNSTP